MVNRSIVRFPTNTVTWFSNNLYNVHSPKNGRYILPFDFEGYDQLIGLYYKNPQHFYFKGQLALNCILRHYLHKLIWDSNTGYISLEASGNFLSVLLYYSDFHTSFSSTKKVLSILERLSALKILEQNSKFISVKIYLQKLNEFLKLGTEREMEFRKRACEMNDIDFDEEVKWSIA